MAIGAIFVHFARHAHSVICLRFTVNYQELQLLQMLGKQFNNKVRQRCAETNICPLYVSTFLDIYF